jgi:outer membrane lipoprotein SlyB
MGVGVTSAFTSLGGALVGGIAGSAAEHVSADTKAFEYIVRKGNGDLVSVTQKDVTPLALGQHVLVIAGNQARVVPDYTVPPEVKPAKAAEPVKPADTAPSDAKPADTSPDSKPADPAAAKPDDAMQTGAKPAPAAQVPAAQVPEAQVPAAQVPAALVPTAQITNGQVDQGTAASGATVLHPVKAEQKATP